MPIERSLKALYNLLVYRVFLYPRQSLASMDYDEYWRRRTASCTSTAPALVRPIKHRDRIVPSLIPPGSSVLDVGCGDCRMLAIVRERTPGVGELLGVDVYMAALRRCREREVPVLQIDLERERLGGRIDGAFDVVLLCDILEHLANPEQLLRDVREIVQRRVILTVPNIAFFPHRLRLLLGKFPLDWSWHPGEHIRHWSIPDFKWWLCHVVGGFSVEQVWPLEGIPLVKRLLPNLFAASVLYVLSPQDDE